MEDIYTELNNLLIIYTNIISTDISHYELKEKSLVLPLVPLKIITKLFRLTTLQLQKDEILIKLKEKIVIVGDLHGHLLDLIRIFQKFGLPPNKKYLFLGDIVDRGEFSLETITLIFLLKIFFPTYIYIIRGNHEFLEMNKICGFSIEISKTYGNLNLEKTIMETFSYLPIAALLFDKILCIHGGIGPSFTNLNQISEIKRPIHDYNFEPLTSILWSDPSNQIQNFKKSIRGTGYLFGSIALNSFLKYQNLELIIRGHEPVDEGIFIQFGKKIITVFSASFYCGLDPNKSGVLIIDENNIIEKFNFEPIKYLYRNHVLFFPTDLTSSILIFSLKKNKIKFVPRPKSSINNRQKPLFSNLINIKSLNSNSIITPKKINNLPNEKKNSINCLLKKK